jgi:hypothetical protein
MSIQFLILLFLDLYKITMCLVPIVVNKLSHSIKKTMSGVRDQFERTAVIVLIDGRFCIQDTTVFPPINYRHSIPTLIERQMIGLLITILFRQIIGFWEL